MPSVQPLFNSFASARRAFSMFQVELGEFCIASTDAVDEAQMGLARDRAHACLDAYFDAIHESHVLQKEYQRAKS